MVNCLGSSANTLLSFGVPRFFEVPRQETRTEMSVAVCAYNPSTGEPLESLGKDNPEIKSRQSYVLRPCLGRHSFSPCIGRQRISWIQGQSGLDSETLSQNTTNNNNKNEQKTKYIICFIFFFVSCAQCFFSPNYSDLHPYLRSIVGSSCL